MRDKDRNRKSFMGRIAELISGKRHTPPVPGTPMHGPNYPGGPGRKPSGVAAAKRAKAKRRNVQARKSKRNRRKL